MGAPVSKSGIEVADWPGLVSNTAPDAGPPGAAAEQVNLACLRPGEIQVRPGTAPVEYDDEG